MAGEPIRQILRFEPPTPQSCMIHVYLKGAAGLLFDRFDALYCFCSRSFSEGIDLRFLVSFLESKPYTIHIYRHTGFLFESISGMFIIFETERFTNR